MKYLLILAVVLSGRTVFGSVQRPNSLAEAFRLARGASEMPWAERLDASFAIGSEQSIIGANDLGLVNGVRTFISEGGEGAEDDG